MNAVTPIRAFDAYAAYQREREHSRLMETRLATACMILRMECDRRQSRGEDVSHIREFLKRAAS